VWCPLPEYNSKNKKNRKNILLGVACGPFDPSIFFQKQIVIAKIPKSLVQTMQWGRLAASTKGAFTLQAAK
jgi:hypothetical protein